MEFNLEKHNELIRSLQKRELSDELLCDRCNINRVMVVWKGSSSKCNECYNKLIKASQRK